MYVTKIIEESKLILLEKEVNDFIKDKEVVNISYSFTTVGIGFFYSALILYKED